MEYSGRRRIKRQICVSSLCHLTWVLVGRLFRKMQAAGLRQTVRDPDNRYRCGAAYIDPKLQNDLSPATSTPTQGTPRAMKECTHYLPQEISRQI